MRLENDLVSDLRSIEEDAVILDKLLKENSTKDQDSIHELLKEIIASAITCRQKALTLVDKKEEYHITSIVTPKEVRELLEDFA